MHLLSHKLVKDTHFEDNEFSQSISQCIDPLINSYKQSGWWKQSKWPNVTSLARYIILFMTPDSKKVEEFMLKLPEDLVANPVVDFAVDVSV